MIYSTRGPLSQVHPPRSLGVQSLGVQSQTEKGEAPLLTRNNSGQTSALCTPPTQAVGGGPVAAVAYGRSGVPAGAAVSGRCFCELPDTAVELAPPGAGPLPEGGALGRAEHR